MLQARLGGRRGAPGPRALYVLTADPDEIENLANGTDNDNLMLSLNSQLIALIAAEIVGVAFPIELPSDLATIRGMLT